MASDLDFFAPPEVHDILAAVGAGSPDRPFPDDDRLDGCSSARGGGSTVSSCEAPPHAGDVEDGDVMLSDSTTDVSDSEAPPFLLPAGVWDTRIFPDDSHPAGLYRRLLPATGDLPGWPTGRWWLGGVCEEDAAAAAACADEDADADAPVLNPAPPCPALPVPLRRTRGAISAAPCSAHVQPLELQRQ
jgi:hypothetical protein